MKSNQYLSVQSLSKYLKYKFDKDPYLQRVFLKGELSNVKQHSNGHIYFSVKDDSAVINAVMFRSFADKIDFKPEEGQNVLLSGNVSLYTGRSQYQILVKEMEIDGIGQLFLKLEENKKLLREKGYFSSSHKKSIPFYPKHIAIISSKTSAAIKDMITTLSRRYPLVKVTLLNTYVQGELSKDSVISNLKRADSLDADTVLLARGGGSIEDLWTFNELDVALTVFNMKTPIITGVGHETDITLVDYVSDLRAPTPTAAAEQAVPNSRDLLIKIRELKEQAEYILNNGLSKKRKHLESLSSYYKFKNPNLLYSEETDRLNEYTMMLENKMKESLVSYRHNLSQRMTGLNYNSPLPEIKNKQLELKRLVDSLNRSTKQQLKLGADRLNKNIQVLESVSPGQILKRGYSYTTYQGNIVSNAKELKKGNQLEITFDSGSVKAEVIEVTKDGEK
jgi:exodeoxyribonuclease VII large subunit